MPQLSNFFDPDSFLSITALTYAADPFLYEQARGLLETNEQFICPHDTPVCTPCGCKRVCLRVLTLRCV